MIAWVDIFAVRQWVGNNGDLAFESIVRNMDVLMLVGTHVESITKLEPEVAGATGTAIPADALQMCVFF